MESYTNVQIERVGLTLLPQLLTFVMKMRKEVFPMLRHESLPLDLEHFHAVYLEPADAAFFAALTPEREVVGSIAALRYDNRIEPVQELYKSWKTAEVVKCYVRSDLRRKGVGASLVQRLLLFCQEAGYEKAYLHTHLFLPGAVSFWERQGFHIRMVGNDDMETIHMDRQLDESVSGRREILK